MLLSSKLSCVNLVCLRRCSTKARPDDSRKELSRKCSDSNEVLVARLAARATPASSTKWHAFKFTARSDVLCDKTPARAVAALGPTSLPRNDKDSSVWFNMRPLASSKMPWVPSRHCERLKCRNVAFTGREPTSDAVPVTRWSFCSRTSRSSRLFTCKVSSMRPIPRTVPPELASWSTRSFGKATFLSMQAASCWTLSRMRARASFRCSGSRFVSIARLMSKIERRATLKHSWYLAVASLLPSVPPAISVFPKEDI
mmetsp:Transcript_125942/g.362174  ORF Transcript_125942/g.362174 Transcript_125942/m.362174 type:complete len:256 (+) Transcript_125942:702-1469(+)